VRDCTRMAPQRPPSRPMAVPVAHRIQLRARHEHLFTYSGRSVLVTDLDGRVARPDRFGIAAAQLT
jgi:hypothetical protein